MDKHTRANITMTHTGLLESGLDGTVMAGNNMDTSKDQSRLETSMKKVNTEDQ